MQPFHFNKDFFSICRQFNCIRCSWSSWSRILLPEVNMCSSRSSWSTILLPEVNIYSFRSTWSTILLPEENICSYRRTWSTILLPEVNMRSSRSTWSTILLPVSLQSDVVDLWYFKLWILLDRLLKVEISYIITL